MSTLGLDIGTSGCKALVFSADGKLLAEARRSYNLNHPKPGWYELDPDEVVSACFQVIREVATAAVGDRICALAISSQGEAFIPVDSHGQSLFGAMVSSDTRAAAFASEWSQEFGVDRLYEITGHTPHPLFTLFKLLWLRAERPGVWDNAVKFLCFEDFLHLRLGLEPAISWPLAGRTMLFDVKSHIWSSEILYAVGVSPSQLARPLPSGASVGTIPSDICSSLSLPPGVVVVTGGHDQVCAALGSGALQSGSAMYASGTVECIAATMNASIFTDELRDANLCTYDHAIPGFRATLAFSLTGGNLLAWFRDQWCRTEIREAAIEGEDSFSKILKDLPKTPSGLLVLPYFTPSGTPYFDALTPGAILGLRLSTTRQQVLRALMEGVAMEMRLNLELMQESGLAIETLRAVGGGARNDALLQLKADVTGRVIERVEVTEAGCLGTALLAASYVSGESVQLIADRWIKVTAVVNPNPSATAFYQEQFEKYRSLQPILKDLY